MLTPRVRTLIFVGIAVLALLLLAASLSGLQLSDGRPVPTDFSGPKIFDYTMPDEVTRWIMAIVRVAIIIAWVSLPFFIIYLIISKEARKRLLRDLMAFLPILLFLMMLSSLNREAGEGEGVELAPGVMGTMEPGTLGTPYPLPEYMPPPTWVTTATTIAIAVGVTLLIAGVVMILLRRSRLRTEPLRLVQEEAQAALESIQAGGDLREAILRCYLQMITALKEYRGISRGRDMTPHEFERILQERGLPRGPVHDLTQLFEQVRYGGYNPGRQEERVAVSSLSAIVTACQRSRGE